jgi:Fe-Mn family superoxide dismutase
MFKLPDLPYSFDALEPYIDEMTMKIHHDKHHAGYVDKLNKTLEGHNDLQNLAVEDLLAKVDDLPADIKQAVINNGGGHANHSMFWEIMEKGGGGEPSGKLKEEIDRTFSGLEKFKEEFTNKSLSLFGSGWVFLILRADKSLFIKRHSFQNSPLMHGNIPLMGIDVWEHAYYLRYQNRRADYVEAWWNVVNWGKIEENFNIASK